MFVSSALQELADERAAARAAIARLRLSPVMFELGARPYPPRQLYRSYLAQSDIFLAVYWKSYGWVAPGETISGLEDEYRLAGNLPKLIYLKSPAPDRDPRLTALIHLIESDDHASYKPFRSAPELQELIENDLALMLCERFELSTSRSGATSDDLLLNNLPLPANRLIGREFELSSACCLLRQEGVRLVTLVGPGGTGKSRLGLQVALDLVDDFPDGCYLVALESVNDPALVLASIAHTLLAPAGRDSAATPVDMLVDHLRGRRLLLLLDNFEQVAEAGQALAELIERCPRLKVLVTSRAPLRIRAERELFVPPLAVPLQTELGSESLSQYAAVALFIERAQAVKRDFAVTNENAPAVAAICHRLDGLPLAIELAAARVRMLSPGALLARLERRLDLLQGGARDSPERQHTMRRTIGWSYDLLDEESKSLFHRLSVFPDTWSLEAAEEVCLAQAPPETNLLDGMESLVNASLAVRRDVDDDLRFGMLETIREYALERLLESGESESLRRRLADFYLSFVERAEGGLRGGDQIQWANRLETEHNNIRGVLGWCRERDPMLGLRLSGLIWRFWEMRNFMTEGRAWLEAFLAASPIEASGRTRALHGASALAAYIGDYEAARRHTKEALAISREHEDKRGVATALNELGLIAMYRADYATAARLFNRSLAIKRELGNAWHIANSLGNLGLIAAYQQDYAQAYALHDESLRMYRAEEDVLGVAISLGNLGHTALHLGRLAEARALQTESVLLFHRLGDGDGEAESLERFAMLALAEGNPAHAACLLAAATRLREHAGTLMAPAELAERQAAFEAVRAQLEPGEFEPAWQEGSALSREAAVKLAAEGPAIPTSA